MMKKFNAKWHVNFKYLLLSLCLALNPPLLKASPIWVSSINGGTFNIDSPAGITVDYSSEDPLQQSIFVSDSTGQKIIKFNGIGQNPGQFNNVLNAPLNSPRGLAIGVENDLNYLWIASRFEETTPGLFGKIRILKSDGSDSLRLPDDLFYPPNPGAPVTFNRPYSVAIDTYRQRAYVLDSNNGKVQSFIATGAVGTINPNFIAGLSVPQGITVKPLAAQPTGEIFIADSGNNLIKKYNTNGDLSPIIIGAVGVGNGQFQSPTGVAVVDETNSPIWVVDNAADNANYQLNRLQVFDKDGNFLSKVDNINAPTAVSVNPKTGIVAVAEFQDQIKMFFDPRAWVLSGKSILPQLPLNLAGGELELAPGALINRRLVVTASASGDNISIPAGTNNGLLTLENATLKLTGTGSATEDNRLEADTVKLNIGGNLVLNGGKFKIDNWTFNGGTLKISKDATIPASVSPNPNVVKLSPQGGTIDVDNGRTLTVNRSFISEPLNGTYTLIKKGGGDLALSTLTPSIDGTLSIEAGSFTNFSSALTFGSSSHLTISAGAQFRNISGRTTAISNGAEINNNGAIYNDGAWVLYGTLTNSGTFSNNSPGSLPNSTGNFKFKGGTFDTYSNATVNWNMSLDNGNGTIITRGGRTFIITQPITGNGNLTISGPGTTVLNGSNSYNGSTSITSQATVKFTANSPFGLGNVSIQDGSTLQWGSAVTLPNNFTFFATIPTLNTSTYNGGISGKLSGGIGFIKKGSGSLTLSGNNDYDDSTTIEEGTLIAAHNNALGTASVYMKNGTVFQSGLNGLVLQNANNFILDSGSVATSGTVTINTANNFTTLSGTISQNNGPMKLIVQGGRTLTLGSQASHSGGTDVQGGTTLIAGLANLFTSANHNLSLLDANSIFDMSAGNQTLGNINGVTGTFIELGNKTLTFGTSNDSNIASGIDGVGGKIVKQGTGTWSVSGNNSYSGGTTINAGTVKVNHNNAFGSGNVTMKDGTTFVSEKTLNLSNKFTLEGNPIQGVTFDTKTFSTFLSGVIDGMNKLIIKGSGTLTMLAQNLFTGGLNFMTLHD